jgi:creatinine amidohydrolase
VTRGGTPDVRAVADLTSPEYASAIGSSLVILPMGAIEAHGPHLPLSTDTTIAVYLAEEIARRMGALVLPPISYGHRTDPIRAGGLFAGATSVRAATLIHLVRDILTSTYDAGGRRFLVVHAHFANVPVVYEALDLFIASSPSARVMAASWWDLAPEETRDQIATEQGVPRTEDHHAAMVETSLMMHIAPDEVRMECLVDDDSRRRARYLVLPPPPDLCTETGVLYQATKASATIGRRLLEEIVDGLEWAVRTDLLDPG